MPLTELQVLLNLIQHSSTASVDAEMLEGKLEIRYVGLVVHLEHFPTDQADEELQLLHPW